MYLDKDAILNSLTKEDIITNQTRIKGTKEELFIVTLNVQIVLTLLN